jgi:hypothetical protein
VVASAETIAHESGLAAHEVVEVMVAAADYGASAGSAPAGVGAKLRLALAHWMSGHAGRRVAPLECPGCGAPVPLATDVEVRCRHCDGVVRLPRAHVALHREKARARELRRAVDAIWRKMPPSMPPWAPQLVLWGLIATTMALTAVVIVLWATGKYGWSVREALVLGIFGPIFVLIYGMIELLAYWSPYERLVTELTAVRDERFPDLALCRNCSAALTVEVGDLGATCSYCGIESLLGRIRSVTRRRVARETEHARTDLKKAAETAEMLRLQRKIVRIIVPPILIGCLALFWALFPDYTPPPPGTRDQPAMDRSSKPRR